jgi:hypothetical protein
MSVQEKNIREMTPKELTIVSGAAIWHSPAIFGFRIYAWSSDDGTVNCAGVCHDEQVGTYVCTETWKG